MLIFNDGPPRAGKSYDTERNHILPALQAGRHVYARLDGLDHAAIGKHLGIAETRIRELLHHVSPANVVTRFQCRWEPDPDFVPTPEQREDPGRYRIPEELRDALVVIDEVHEFYPASMKPLERSQEQFFARHGQFGMDMVLASQTFDRMHGEIRARVERRVLFRKLSHFAALEKIGIGGKSRYSMRFSINDGNGKFKVTGSETRKYDPAIFPLYAGYQPGTTNTDVYAGGSKEAGGAGLKFYVPLAFVAAIVGIWFVFRFFDPETSGLAAKPEAITRAETDTSYRPPGVANAAPVLPAMKADRIYEGAGVAYVMRLLKDHRPRLIGKYAFGNRVGGWVDLVSTQDHVAERFTYEQLIALGFTVTDTVYGALLRAEGEEVIVTEWPIDRWGTVSDAMTERVRGGAGTRDSAGTPAVPTSTQTPDAPTTDDGGPGEHLTQRVWAQPTVTAFKASS